MSLPLLYSEVKNWGKLVDTDLNTSFCANDFDLALKDSALLLDSERYRNNFLSLRWFQLDSPSIYTRELSHFLNYLTYRNFCLSKFESNCLSLRGLSHNPLLFRLV